MTHPIFKIGTTSQRGQSLLQWQDADNPKFGGFHSLQMPTAVVEYILEMQDIYWASDMLPVNPLVTRLEAEVASLRAEVEHLSDPDSGRGTSG
jgi:hypothetical protein